MSVNSRKLIISRSKLLLVCCSGFSLDFRQVSSFGQKKSLRIKLDVQFFQAEPVVVFNQINPDPVPLIFQGKDNIKRPEIIF